MVYNNNIPRYEFEFNDSSFLNQEICSLASAPIPIIPNSTSPYHQPHNKEQHFDDYIMNSGRISSFTEFLSTDNVNVMETYGIYATAHTTTCSSPESPSEYMFMDDSKIKM